MTPADLLHDYTWAIAIGLVGLFLLSRYIMRWMQARREAEARRIAAAPDEHSLVGPEEYKRARTQFLLALVLLIVIVVLSVITHFR